jgi:hypothetical protein
MKNTTSQKQIDANRHNAKKSTGPKTPAGLAASKMNALKHGILSREVVVHGRCIKESQAEFDALHQRFWEHLNPVGPLEEMLLDQILTTYWRSRRPIKAESGEILLSVDAGETKRAPEARTSPGWWEAQPEGFNLMSKSALEATFDKLLDSFEKAGELTEAILRSVKFNGEPYQLTFDLREFHAKLQENPEKLNPAALRAQQQEDTFEWIAWERSTYLDKFECAALEEAEEAARQAAAVLPPPQILDKILRYEIKLERQMDRALSRLERLQRMRQGDSVPPPLIIEVSEKIEDNKPFLPNEPKSGIPPNEPKPLEDWIESSSLNS